MSLLKRLRFALCILLSGWLLHPTSAQADIIPKDMKAIYTACQIINLDSYPETSFLMVEDLGREIRGIQEFKPNKGLSKGYKLNHAIVMAVPRAIVTPELLSRKDTSALLGTTYPNIKLSGCTQELVSRPSALSGKDYFYRAELRENQLHLNLVETKTYEDRPNHFPINLMAYAFTVTFAIELIVFMLVLRLGFRQAEPKTFKAIAIVLAAQIVTLPFLWFMIHNYNLMGTLVMFGAEAFAVVVEAAIYRTLVKLSWSRAAIISVACNALSYLLGMML